MAEGNIIVFLDAHVKPDPGWAFPILRHINTNYKRVVVPKIPVLNGTTWVVNRKAGKGSWEIKCSSIFVSCGQSVRK